MVGFHSNEIPVKRLAGFRTGLDMELFENFHLNMMASIFAAQEANRNSGFSLLSGLGIGAGYNAKNWPDENRLNVWKL